MKINQLFQIIMYLVIFAGSSSLSAQCDFSSTGTGTFEDGSYTNHWNAYLIQDDMTYGTLSQQESIVHSGKSALKFSVSTANSWQVRIFSKSCGYALKKGLGYRINYWVKGIIGNDVLVTLRNGTNTTIKETTLEVETGSWEEHSVIYYSDADYSDASLKFVFKNVGDYYIDDITLTELDCNGVVDGTAALDSCEICAGGNTGIVPGEYCNTVPIAPNDVSIRYNGILSSKISETEAELYRFSDDFFATYTNSYDYTWNLKNARTNSGISISFKTNSPFIKMKFAELENCAIRARNFSVFKDGELVEQNISGLEFDIENTEKNNALWEVYLPIFSGVKFLGMDINAGYSLSALPTDNAPKYVAIGNSITHGVGQNAEIETYPYQVADALGFRLINLGIGGSRISTSTLLNLSSVSPELITILWGYNDLNNPNDLTVYAFPWYEELISQLCKTQTQAEIYCIMPTYTTTIVGGSNTNNTVETLRNTSRSIIQDLQKTYDNLHIIEGTDYISSSADLNDVVHLNVSGAAKLAAGIANEYNKENTSSSPKLGFFEDFWEPSTANIPASIDKASNETVPEMLIQIDPLDTIAKISPYIGGYNLNTYYGGKIFDKPNLLEHIRNLDMPFFRFPGGSGSDYYFWDAAKPKKPDDVDGIIVKGEIRTSIKWGDEPGKDYLSLNNYYQLRDSTENQGIHVVNYAYARYGLSEQPVTQAAHYAADWVRYDNGRTIFWEIGNENYGSWEAGNEINTSLNLDEQPKFLTGTLYAQHCHVFIDSMRAAAAEIGADIKIGTVIGFKTNYDNWNNAVISGLKNKPDFYSVHKYYGNGEDAETAKILGKIEEFYSEKAYVDGLINQYCDPFVPLVETEWNTRYDGRSQNVSCSNGLFSMLGFKGIINSGIGLSSRWNLIWGYQNGETHGLITNTKDNPSIEGLPAFTPRAPYFYTYYFKRFLGDVSIDCSTSEENDLDIFSSSFNSGEVSVVIVNKGNKTITSALNIDNYSLGEKYYWYTISPTNNNSLSREISVNGFENANYDAGGPANYTEIKANSALTSNGITLTVPPYSVVYVLTEGSAALNQSGYTIDLRIEEISGDSTLPLDKAMLRIEGKTYLTNDLGEASFKLPAGTYTYYLDAEGYISETGTFTVAGDMIIADTLIKKSYTATFNLKYGEDYSPVTSATIILDTISKQYTDGANTEFNNVDYGSHSLDIVTDQMSIQMNIELVSDSLFELSLAKPIFHLGFHCQEMYSEKNLSAITVQIGEESLTTSLNGKVEFTVKGNKHEYVVSGDGYATITASIDLLKDTIVTILMTPELADIKFKLSSEGTPINNSTISILQESGLTNNIGIYNFTDLPTSETYNYLIQHADYDDFSEDFYLRIDTTIIVEMTQTGINTKPKKHFSIYPNPANNEVILKSELPINQILIVDISGKVLYIEQTGISTEKKINLHGIPDGIYFIKTKDIHGNNQIGKLIIQDQSLER